MNFEVLKGVRFPLESLLKSVENLENTRFFSIFYFLKNKR